ncbi:hypothetical protein ECC04_002595 [Pseudomonas aeruginosa]|nr:hypothetical protein ECC04_002595 [Pseudomonas aeruginosa]
MYGHTESIQISIHNRTGRIIHPKQEHRVVSRISAGLAAQLVNFLASQNLDTVRLCKESGIIIDELRSPSKFISRSSVLRLMELAEIESGNPDIGLKAYQHLLPGAFQLVGYAMISSANLKDALLALVRFLPFSETALPSTSHKKKMAYACGTLTIQKIELRNPESLMTYYYHQLLDYAAG